MYKEPPTVILVYDLPSLDGKEFLELVQESLHQGLEYGEYERKIIEEYLEDIALGIAVNKSNP